MPSPVVKPLIALLAVLAMSAAAADATRAAEPSAEKPAEQGKTTAHGEEVRFGDLAPKPS